MLPCLKPQNCYQCQIFQCNINPLATELAITTHTRLRCFKKLQLSQLREHRLNYQSSPFTRKSFKLRYPTNTKISAIFAEYQRLNLDKNKNDRFYVIDKQQKSRFAFSFFLLKSSLQTQKSTFTAKFSPNPSLEVIVFALICCWGRATASRCSAY